MNKIVCLLVALVAFTSAGATELYDKLMKIKGVVSVEQLDKGTFAERYVVMVEQPLDHSNPHRGTFEQRFVVGHSGFEQPTVLVTEGYGGARALLPKYREEISRKFNANQVFVEHRYFGASTPSPRNWNYLTAENAAADLHVIRQALADIYTRAWLATGVSKGGQNTMIYAALYPDDVDVYVPYVGPICTGVEDGRHEPFLERVGTPAERETILSFQREVLQRREKLVPMLAELAAAKGYKFKIPIDAVFDYCVLEYPFSIWQWGTAVSLIPELDAPHEELFDHLIAIVSPDYFALSDEPSFFVQAARELGYYGYDTKPFEGLLTLKSAKGYLNRIFLPSDAGRIRFSSSLATKITQYLKDNDPRMILIYGQNDPWSAAMPASDIFTGKQRMMLVVEPEGSHKARISTQRTEVQDEIWHKLESWLESK